MALQKEKNLFWSYNEYFHPPIPAPLQLSPEPDSIPPLYQLEEFESTDALRNTVIKDESANATGSHKDRSFRYWISWHAMQETKELAIPSSGNSARAAAYYCQKANILLSVFLRADFPEEHKRTLEEYGCAIMQSKTPKRDAIRFANDRAIPLLRGSLDPQALEGYKTIAFELAHENANAEELFIPTSSAATLLGIAEGYRILEGRGEARMPRIYAVQTSAVHPIAEKFDNNFTSESSHRARAIIDRIAHRKNEAIRIIEQTGGGGYVLSEQETVYAQSLLRQPHGFESALTVAALLKHRQRHPEYAHAKAVLLFTN